MADNTLTFSLNADVASFMANVKNASANVSALFKEWNGKDVKISANTADLVKAGSAVRQLVKDAQAAAAKSDIPITVRAAGIQQVQAEIKGLVDTNTKALAALRATGQAGGTEYAELLKSTKAAHAETLAYDNALEEVAAQLGKTGDKKDVKISANTADLVKAGSAVRQLVKDAQAAAAKSDIPITVRAAGIQQVQAEIKGLVDTNTKALAALRATGQAGGTEYAELLKSTKAAHAETLAYDNALEEVAAQLGKTGDKGGGGLMSGAINFAAISAGVAAISTSLTDLSEPLVKLDSVTAQMRTLGAEGKAMAGGLRSAALDMAKELPISADQIQQTMFDAVASGVKGGESGLKTFASTVGKLAVGGGAEIGEATSLLAGQLNAYGAGSEQVNRYSDIFFNTVNFGVTSVKELSSTLANVVPTAAGMGLEIENVGAAIALMTQKGIPAAQATTKFNQLLIEMQKPGAALAPILQKAAVSLESLRNDDLPTSLGKIKTAMDATGKSAVQLFGSSEAAAAYQTLTGDMAGLQQTFRDVQGTTGSTENAYAEMAASIDVQTKQIKSTVQAFATEALGILPNSIVATGRALVELAPSATALGGLSTVAMNSVSAFGKLGKSIKDAGGAAKFITEKAPMLAKFGGTIADSAKGAMDLGKMLLTRALPGTIAQTGATVAQTGATVGATFATRALSLAMTALPIFAIIAGVGLLVAALAGVFSGGETVAEGLEGVGSAMEEANKVIADTAVTDKQQQELKKLGDEYDSLKGKTDPASLERMKVVADQLAIAYPSATVGIAGMGKAVEINTDIVDSFANAQLRANEAMRQGAAAKLAKETGELIQSTADAKKEVEELTEKRAEQQKRLVEIEKAAAKGGFANRNVGQIADAQRKALQETDAQIGEMTKGIQESEKATREAIVSQRKLGMGWEEVAKENGISVEEAKKYEAEQKIIERQAYDAAKAASALPAATYDAVKAAESLAAAWNKVKSEVDASFNTMKGAVLELRRQQMEGGGEILDVTGKAMTEDAILFYEKQGMDMSAIRAKQLKIREERAMKDLLNVNARKNKLGKLEKDLDETINPTVTTKAAKTESIEDAFKATLDSLEKIKARRVADAKEHIRDEKALKVALASIDDQSSRERLAATNLFIGGQAKAGAELKRVMEAERDTRKEILRTVITDTTELEARLASTDAEFEKLIKGFGAKDIGAGIRSATKDIDGFRVSVVDTGKALTDLYKGWQEAQAKADAESLANSMELFDKQIERLTSIDAAEFSLLPDAEQLKQLGADLDAIRDRMLASFTLTALPEEDALRSALALLGKLAAETLARPEMIEAQKALSERLAAIEKDRRDKLADAELNAAGLLAEDVEREKTAITRAADKERAAAIKEAVDVGTEIEGAGLKDRTEQYRMFGDAVRSVYEAMSEALEDNLEEQRKAYEELLRTVAAEYDILVKQFKALQVSSAEFIRQVDELQARLLENNGEEIGFWENFRQQGVAAMGAVTEALKGIGSEFSGIIGTGLSDAIAGSLADDTGKVAEAYDSMKSAVIGATATMAAQTVASLATMAIEGGHSTEEYILTLIDAVDAAGMAIAPLLLVSALKGGANIFVALGIFFASLIGFKALIAGAKAGLAKFGDGGLVGGGEQMALLNDKGKKEYVINGNAVQQYGVGFLDAVNQGRLVINNAGKLAREAGGALPQLNETDLRTLRNLADAFGGVDVSSMVVGLDEPMDIRRALQPPRINDPRAEFAAMIEESLSIQVQPDPHTKAIAEATAASVLEERMMRQENKQNEKRNAAYLASINQKIEKVGTTDKRFTW